MNDINLKIMKELCQNSRIHITSLAKKLRISREVLTYRINKLKEDKTIINFITEINFNKLGFIASAIFVKVKTKKEKEFKEFLNSCNFVSWVAELSGIWSFGFSIYGKNNEDMDKKFSIIYENFKEDIIDYRFLLHGKTEFFYEKYFDSSTKEYYQEKNLNYKIDKKDRLILKILSSNSRIDCVELSKKVNLTAPAIAQRIKKLEKSGFIQKYSLFIDISKINLMQYSVFITNKDIKEKSKLIQYLKTHKKISFIAEYIGEPFVEFGVVVNNPYMLREVLREVEESFPENKIFEISMFQKEFVSIGPPSYILE